MPDWGSIYRQLSGSPPTLSFYHIGAPCAIPCIVRLLIRHSRHDVRPHSPIVVMLCEGCSPLFRRLASSPFLQRLLVRQSRAPTTFLPVTVNLGHEVAEQVLGIVEDAASTLDHPEGPRVDGVRRRPSQRPKAKLDVGVVC
jgi:hypothetical protein